MLSTKASVGLFVCAGAVLFGAGLFLLGDRKKLFSRSFEVRSDFESVAGLEQGANVRVSGLNAGEVKEIEILAPADGKPKRFRLHLRVDRKLQPLVRMDSTAMITTEGLVGNKYLEISPAETQQGNQCTDPCTVASKETFDFSDLMQEARGLISHSDEAIQKAGDVAQNLNRTLDTFLARGANGKNGAENLNATMASAQAAMTNLADNTEALKHNFLLRGFFNKRGFYNLTEITPAEYRSSDFVSNKKAKRIWVEASALFTPGAKDQEQLSPAGRKSLDSAMASFAADLVNSPLMVEAYAPEGAPDSRFRRSQQRGVLVQNYLQQRFGLKPKFIGSMPLIDMPPPKTGKDAWDGVALVLLPQK